METKELLGLVCFAVAVIAGLAAVFRRKGDSGSVGSTGAAIVVMIVFLTVGLWLLGFLDLFPTR